MLHFWIQTSDRNLNISGAKRTEAYADPQLIEDPTLKVAATEQWVYVDLHNLYSEFAWWRKNQSDW